MTKTKNFFTSKKNLKGFIPHYEGIAYLSEEALNFQPGEHKNKTRKTLITGYSAGFTFVEVIVTMFVLVAVMVAVAGIHSSLTKGYRKTGLTQKDLEQAQHTMNLMSKVIRTGFVRVPSVAAPSATDIIVYDMSQQKCVRFEFDSNKLKTVSVTAVGSNDKERMQYCGSSTPGIDGLVEITNTHVDAGYFAVTPTVIDDDDRIVSTGKVTVVMNICPSSGCATSSPVIIQSTVSQRIYKEISPAF